MKLPKIIAVLLIIGLSLQSAAFPETVQGLWTEPMVEPQGTSPRDKPLSTMAGGEQTLDPFTVHPANRWSSATSGTFDDTIENGELAFQGYDNSSASIAHFRDAGTADDTIATRWRLNATDSDSLNTSGSDFEIPLIGLNATTAEGTGNATLNAYQWNSTHYTVRPTFTTGDGTNWRSWNLESNYQEYSGLNGSWGADGWDFLEGDDDGASYSNADDYQALGYNRLNPNAATVLAFFLTFEEVSIDTSLFDYLEVKLYSNVSDLVVQPRDGTSPYPFLGDLQSIPTNWTILYWDLSSDSDWTGTNTRFQLVFDETGGDGEPEDDNFVWIDYIRLTTNNDTSDLTFLDYETYYRSELEFNLRRSELSYLIMDDLGDDLAEEEIGDFSIASYFAVDELIPDVFLGEVGSIDYLLGARTAGANVTVWWDYYEAEFAKFTWTQTTLTETNDTWDGKSQFLGWNEFSGNALVNLELVYSLTVPEFDACSGKISLHEEGANVIGIVGFVVASANSATGALSSELSVSLWGATTDPAFGGADTAHQLVIDYGGTTKNYFFEDNRNSELTFSISNDKTQNVLSLQMSYISNRTAGGEEITVSFTEEVANSGNEFVLRTVYLALGADTLGGGQPGTDEEINMALEDFALLEKDLFGGFKLPLPDIDVPSFDGIFDILLEPLVALLNGILGLPRAIGDIVGTAFEAVGNAITASVDAIGVAITASVDAIGVAITASVDAIGVAITASVDAIGVAITASVDLVTDAVDAIGVAITAAIETLETAIETALEAVEDAVDLVTDAVDLVTAAIGTLAAGIITALTDAVEDIVDEILGFIGTIWTAIVTFIRAITIQGVSVGSVLDVVFQYLSFFTNTAADTIQFLVMIMTEWGVMLMVFIFLIILFGSIASANAPGEVFGNFFRAYSANTTPFSVLGFSMYIPLAAWNLPFIFIVVLGIV